MSDLKCVHVTEIKDVKPKTKGCEECMKAKSKNWVQLRMCLSCGHVGCCDSSPGKHATAHYHETQHPIIQAFGSGEDWIWCYVDEIYEALPKNRELYHGANFSANHL